MFLASAFSTRSHSAMVLVASAPAKCARARRSRTCGALGRARTSGCRSSKARFASPRARWASTRSKAAAPRRGFSFRANSAETVASPGLPSRNWAWPSFNQPSASVGVASASAFKRLISSSASTKRGTGVEPLESVFAPNASPVAGEPGPDREISRSATGCALMGRSWGWVEIRRITRSDKAPGTPIRNSGGVRGLRLRCCVRTSSAFAPGNGISPVSRK